MISILGRIAKGHMFTRLIERMLLEMQRFQGIDRHTQPVTEAG